MHFHWMMHKERVSLILTPATYKLADMTLTTANVSAMVETELSRISCPQTAALIRSLLVPPRCELRPWDYGLPDASYPCWIVAEHVPSKSAIAYCEEGFGPKLPWGLLWSSGDRLNMGMDCGWFASLEDAAKDSFAWPESGPAPD